MADAQPQQFSLRWSRLEKKRLLAALIFSLLLHVAGLGVYQWGVKHHWWQPVKILSMLPPKPPVQKPPPPPKDQEEQVVFVDVNHEEKEPPKKAKYYSNKNSQAANPDASKNLNDPKIEGKQSVMPKTESVPRTSKLQFATPAPTGLRGLTPAPKEAPHERGDLDLAQKTSEQKQTPPTQKPRTLKEAQQNLTAGEQMKQDGGVRRQRIYSSLDAKQTPFGNYDKQIVDAVTDRWYAMLDGGHFAQDRTGKVVVRFKLKYDGSILEMTTLENSVGISLTYVCRQAIAEAAPFSKWPDDMRRMIGANFREVSFTFYYY